VIFVAPAVRDLPRRARGLFGALSVCVGLAAALAGPQEASAQTLQEELRLLVQTHPRIEEQRAILRRAQDSVASARGGYLPTVTGTGSFGWEMTSDTTTRLANNDNDILRFNTLGIEVRQSLYDGALTDNSVAAALLARDSVAFALEGTVQQVMLQGIRAYLDVLRLNELIRVSRARERTIREQLNLETERVERGAGIEVDVLQAKSRLQLAIEARVNLEGQLRRAMAEYVASFQRQPDITQMRLTPPPLEIVPPSVDEAIGMARINNPVLAGRQFLARSARYTIEAQRAGYHPSIDLVGRANHENGVGGVRDQKRDGAVLIELSWQMFSGFRTDSAVESAQETMIERLAATDRTQREVERQVRQAWTKLENTRERKELLLNAVSIAQEVFTARRKLRAAGKETTLNVLDAENEVFQAEQNLIRADYDARVAVYELGSAMGILTPDLLELDVRIIENFSDYRGGADDVSPLDPDPVVQQRRDEIRAIQAEDPFAPPAPPPPEAMPEPSAPDDVGEEDTVIEPPPETSAAPDAEAAPPSSEVREQTSTIPQAPEGPAGPDAATETAEGIAADRAPETASRTAGPEPTSAQSAEPPAAASAAPGVPETLPSPSLAASPSESIFVREGGSATGGFDIPGSALFEAAPAPPN
jgi:adhesin transport system outer membrane protein